ncbi:MarR family transcriptional regulator [Ferruginibacter paludis]|jgi:DNA-binding MarR family transcriptional regulator|uniref:MarR family winged helix-turn-helix transcriptional regulator n=1 Tax=Ferruginibacter TaxID=1004303 RepID=UPI0025B57C6D|nr:MULTISPECIES: MarR family transcriptional regulator [Ferruginibacter]MDN3659103.1 MarR family transcriptional regulator [Ferruginibacter paludis]
MDCKEMPDTLGFMIVHTGKLLLKTINGAFSGITKDITFEQLGVLYYLSRSTTKEMIQQDIATVMDKTKSAILRSIDILEEKGFVKRLPVAGDRRKNVIELTSTGKSIIDIMHGKFLGQDGILKEGISEKDVETCMDVLAKIQEKCK